MIRLLFLVLVQLLPNFALAEEQTKSDLTEVFFVRGGLKADVPESISKEIETAILESVKATGFDSTSSTGSYENWKKLAIGSYLILRYPRAKKIVVNHDRQVLANEVLVPVSRDSHYLVRNLLSGEYWAFTKMMPDRRAKLVCRPEFLVKENEGFCEFWKKFGNKK